MEKQKEEEKELFADTAAASNAASGDGFLKAVAGAVTAGVILVVILAALGIKGGILGIVPVIIAYFAYRAIRRKSG